MRIKLKNFKDLPELSLDSHAFSASIYLDNRKVGTASDRGDGMPPKIVWTNCNDQTFLEACKEDGVEKYYEYQMKTILQDGEDLNFGIEAAVEVLAEIAQTTKQVKRDAKNKIVFWKPTEFNSWYTAKVQPTQENFDRLRNHHGDGIFIFNEMQRVPMVDDLELI